MSGEKLGGAGGSTQATPDYHGNGGTASGGGGVGAKVVDAAQKLGGQATDAAQKLGAQATDAAQRIGSEATDAAQKLGGQAKDMGSQVYRQAVDAGRYAGQQIEEQPLTAMLVAGGVGLLIGFLLGRGSVEQPRSWRDYADDYLPRRFR